MKMNELHFSNKSEQEYTIMDSVEKFWKQLSQPVILAVYPANRKVCKT
jgi:hypothetical protein